MLGRVRPWLILLGTGLAGLLWGLASLQAMVLSERDEARAALGERRLVLEQYAARTLTLKLQSKLSEARSGIEAAQHDPLLAGGHAIVFEHGEQVLPRPPSTTQTNAATELLSALLAGEDVPALEPSPWSERLILFAKFRSAAQRGDRGQLQPAFRALLKHRSRHIIDSRLDIPLRIAALELLADHGPRHALMVQLLRDGMAEPGPQTGERRLFEGLQPALLRSAPRLSRSDFMILGNRIVNLCARFEVTASDFELRLHEPRTRIRLDPMPEAPALVHAGRHFVVPETPGHLVGVEVDVAAELQATQEDMTERGLLGTADVLHAPSWPKAPLLTRDLQLRLDIPRFDRAEQRLNHRLHLKTSFIAVSAALAVLLVVLAFVLQSRRQRFVELKGSFVAAVSHELRTPLASIRLLAETLERKTKGFAAARDYPTRIVAQVDDLAFLVENLLSFNRLQKGRWTPRRARLTGSRLLTTLQEDLEGLKSRGLRIRSLGLEELELSADPELFRLLFRNLGKNACSYNERDPVELELRGTVDSDGLHIEVSDNGVGISEADRERVFTDFYRPSGSKVRGSGLGLAICRHIARAHAGSIEISRSGPEGTTFSLRFPPSILEPPPNDH